jgi:hypothetical protein
MNLVQFKDPNGSRRVGVPTGDGAQLRLIDQFSTVYELVFEAIRQGTSLADLVPGLLSTRYEPYDEIIRGGRVLVPDFHDATNRCRVSFAGLKQLGIPKNRNDRHDVGRAYSREIKRYDVLYSVDAE